MDEPLRVQVRTRPELEVKCAPELHPRLQAAAPVPLEPAPRRSGVDEAAVSKRARPEDVRRELAKAAAQPEPLRRDEAELVAPLADDRRQQVSQGTPEHGLRPPAADELAPRQREAQLDEPVVEERHPRLERVRHRVAVLVAK